MEVDTAFDSLNYNEPYPYDVDFDVSSPEKRLWCAVLANFLNDAKNLMVKIHSGKELGSWQGKKKYFYSERCLMLAHLRHNHFVDMCSMVGIEYSKYKEKAEEILQREL